MNVLITGGNGFLGSNLVRALVQKNYNVLVVSRRCNSLADLLTKIKFIQQKGGYMEHEEAIRAFSPDYVIHFAWDGGNSYADVNSLTQFSVNIPHGVELLEIVKNLPTKPVFMGVGSFAEYGILSQKAVETQTDAPITFYGMAKSMFKTISQTFCSNNDIRWAWIRPCYIYGQNDVHTRLIPSVGRKLLEKKEVRLDSCSVTIDYLHVNDFSSALLDIMRTSSVGIFNVCSGREYNLKDILMLLKEKTGASTHIVFDASLDRTHLSKYICGDNSRLLELGWVPRVSIEDGLTEVVRDIRMELFLKSNPVDYDGLCDATL